MLFVLYNNVTVKGYRTGQVICLLTVVLYIMPTETYIKYYNAAFALIVVFVSIMYRHTMHLFEDVT
jgi:hypothetical protein